LGGGGERAAEQWKENRCLFTKKKKIIKQKENLFLRHEKKNLFVPLETIA
jgi:hypothetical protein